MILKQVILYDNAPVIEVTWVDENDVIVKCHAYSNHPEQIQMLREDLGTDKTEEHESLIARIAAEYAPPPPPSRDDLIQSLRAALSDEYERRMQIIASDYPPSERESWPVQTSEARELLANPSAITPWIDAAAASRAVDRLELATRIVAKDAAYRVIHGAMTGARQRIEDQIFEADTVEKLLSIGVTSGWDLPSVDGPHPDPEESIESTEEEQE